MPSIKTVFLFTLGLFSGWCLFLIFGLLFQYIPIQRWMLWGGLIVLISLVFKACHLLSLRNATPRYFMFLLSFCAMTMTLAFRYQSDPAWCLASNIEDIDFVLMQDDASHVQFVGANGVINFPDIKQNAVTQIVFGESTRTLLDSQQVQCNWSSDFSDSEFSIVDQDGCNLFFTSDGDQNQDLINLSLFQPNCQSNLTIKLLFTSQ